MKITLIKKIMEDGGECRKCREVAERLEAGDEMRFIDRVIIADVREPGSEGMRIAAAHKIETAPFFVVEEDGKETLYKTYMQFKRKVLQKAVEAADAEIEEKRKAEAEVDALETSSGGQADAEIEELNRRFENKSPQKLLEWALKRFHPKIALAWSGAEDVALVDMLVKIHPGARIFTLDTGRLNPETYNLIDQVREHYGIEVEVLSPEREETETMVKEKGVNLFYESVENRKRCCNIRKVQPLKRMLSGLDAWITGLRRDQAVTRTVIPKVEKDETFGGIIKLNPLAGWTHEEIWNYIRGNNVPYNALHDQNYPSIGCAPCTRARGEGEDIRAGRWWWESPEQKECGLHVKSEK